MKLDKRYIYVMGNTNHLFKYKIGIAENVERRRKEIQQSLGGTQYVIMYFEYWIAPTLEAFLHTIYSPLHVKRMRGSGHTEWFWMIFPVTPIIFLCIFKLLQSTLGIILMILLIYWWQHR